MHILMVGGGSGGHVTPLKAVAKEILGNSSEHSVEVFTDTRFVLQARQIFSDMPEIPITKIYAGKFRRYNSKSFLWHLTHLPTVLKNIRDIVLTGVGIMQAIFKFAVNRPDIVFCKGGFVSVPVGFSAHLFHVPIIIHDSDTHAGLSSRIVSRWANTVATGMPTEYYDYPEEKTVYTGIPVDNYFKPTSQTQQLTAKKALGLDSSPVLLITGGGTGAERINLATERVGESLVDSGWQIILVTGSGKSASSKDAQKKLSKDKRDRWRIFEFVDLKQYIRAADVVVTRTGATTMQELANAQKTVITIPSRFLTGGHQLKNAQMYQEADAAVVLDEQHLEQNPTTLLQAVQTCLVDSQSKSKLAKKLYKSFAKPNAAKDLASIILRQKI